MCQIAVNFRFFMPFNFGWKAYFSARGQGVDFYFSARGRGVGLSAQLAYKSSCFFVQKRLQRMSAAAFFALRFGLFQKVLNQSVQEASIVGTDGDVDFRQVRPDVVMAAIHNRHAEGQTVLRRYANAAAHALE